MTAKNILKLSRWVVYLNVLLLTVPASAQSEDNVALDDDERRDAEVATRFGLA